VDYAELSARLPAGVEPGFDGMVIDIPECELEPDPSNLALIRNMVAT